MVNPSLHLDRTALHLNSSPYCLFRPKHRYYIEGRPTSGVYIEIVCRKRGEGIAEEKCIHVDTSTTPVRPLFSQHVHSPVHVGL